MSVKPSPSATFQLMVEVVKLHREWQEAKAASRKAARRSELAGMAAYNAHAAEDRARARHQSRLQAVNLLLEHDEVYPARVQTLWREAEQAVENEA